MKKFTSTLLGLLFCMYLTAQVGSLDHSFNTTGFVITNTGSGPGINDQIQGIGVQTDGRIVTVGYGDDQNFTIARYTSAGVLDSTFATNAIAQYRPGVGASSQAYAVAFQSDGKIVVAGWSWPGSNKDFCVMRLNNDGSLDNTFGTNGAVVTDIGGVDEGRSVAIQNDGKIVVAGFTYNGTDSNFAVVRYTTAGVLDGSFGGTGIVTTNINSDDLAESIAINNSTGTITVGGTSNTGGNGDFALVRYTSAGAADGSFGSGGIVTTDIGTGTNDQGHALALQPDGKILLAGSTSTGGNKDVAVVRYTTTGGLDGGFGGTGIVTTNYGPVVNTDDDARSIALQNDGKIVVGGATDGAGSTFAFLALRYSSAGVLDPTFGSSGKAAADLSTSDADISFAMKLVNNRIYLGGYSGAPRDFALAALQSDGSPLPLTLTQFYAQKQTSKVLLQWQTSNEENVKQFIIERSNDGKTYTAIGQVAAAGNSTITKNYAYTDPSPYMSDNNYYRLKMLDIDGNYKYSKVLIIKFTGELSTNVQVFPSPVKDLLQIQLPRGLSGIIGLQIIDINGRIVKRNNIASDGNALNTSFDVSSLPNGVYMLKAQAGNTIITTRFSKL